MFTDLYIWMCKVRNIQNLYKDEFTVYAVVCTWITLMDECICRKYTYLKYLNKNNLFIPLNLSAMSTFEWLSILIIRLIHTSGILCLIASKHFLLLQARASAKKFRKVTLNISPKGIIVTDTETSNLIENVSIYR